MGPQNLNKILLQIVTNKYIVCDSVKDSYNQQLPTLVNSNFYGRSGVCLALHITPDKPHGWEYSVFVFLFLNSLSFTLIALSYLLMFIAARTTRLAVSCDRRSTESAIAWRMTLLVATDAACWVPIIGLGLASLAGFTIPSQVRVRLA